MEADNYFHLGVFADLCNLVATYHGIYSYES